LKFELWFSIAKIPLRSPPSFDSNAIRDSLVNPFVIIHNGNSISARTSDGFEVGPKGVFSEN